MFGKISIIGSGNTAFVLGQSLYKSGHIIHQISSRNKEEGKKLAIYTKSNYTTIDKMDLSADTILFCISDSAINEMAFYLKDFKGLAIHCSGSVDINDLLPIEKRAVLYPYVSMVKNTETNFKDVSIFIEANNEKNLETVSKIANLLTKNVSTLSSSQRIKLHIAGVFAHNFVNHLLHLSQDLLEENKLDFNLIKPLIQNYFQKLETTKPSVLQTGPAIRNDEFTLAKHDKFLSSTPILHEIYSVLSKSIQQTHKHG